MLCTVERLPCQGRSQTFCEKLRKCFLGALENVKSILDHQLQSSFTTLASAQQVRTKACGAAELNQRDIFLVGSLVGTCHLMGGQRRSRAEGQPMRRATVALPESQKS